MGVDLTLSPQKYHQMSWWGGFNMISLDRNYEIFDQLGMSPGTAVVTPNPLPQGVRFTWYEDDGLKDRNTDPYGKPLTYLLAADFNNISIPEDASEWNKAAIEFIRHLPPDTPVVLWWH